MKNLWILLAAVALGGCASSEVLAPDDVPASESVTSNVEAGSIVPTLEPLWVADGLDSPEGAAQLPDGTFLVSNVNGQGTARDGNGYISHISADGEVLEKAWADGFNAPKGMAILDGALYVADLDRVHRIDIASRKVHSIINHPKAAFLNDVGVWQNQIYVSDSRNDSLFRIENGQMTVWREGAELDGINGVFGDGERLLIATMVTGSLLSLETNDPSAAFKKIASGITDADGVGLVAGGGYLVSAWRGEIFFVAEDGTVTSIQNTRREGILQNDLSVFGDIVIVPNWNPGTVSAWRITR